MDGTNVCNPFPLPFRQKSGHGLHVDLAMGPWSRLERLMDMVPAAQLCT